MASTTASIPVTGGALAVERTAGSTEPVLCIHGISSQRKLWNWLRAEAPDLALIAPDLRGRGDSAQITGPSSVSVHAADLIAVLDHLGLAAVHVCGMSMGGFVAAELAARYPDRVKSLVLLDGGLPMSPPPGITAETVEQVFTDRLSRLERTFATVEEYAAFFTASTGPLLDQADPLLLDYLAHDLHDGRVRLNAAALGSDARSVFFGVNRVREISVPMRLSYAEWGSGADTAPAYTDELVASFSDLLTTVVKIPGVDHAGSIMTKTGAVVAAELLSEALA